MQTSQRGSVLLTIIGGIVILALLGMVAVSLMTGSVMTGLDAKQTVQASYLAESGKEIVRVQTAQQSGGEMMSIARQLEESSRQHNGKGIEIDGKGFVKLTLYPSWFRWYEDKLHLTDSGWYGGVPNGKCEMLVLNQNGAMRYAYENGFGSETPGSTAADVYLIGRVQGENGSITYDTTKRTLTVKTTADDLKWFPEYGGLIGLVRQQGKDSQLPTSTQVSKLRFTYDSKKTDGDVHTFTNFIPLSEGTISEDTFKDKDIVLGQYFRVVSEAQTLNGARAALVWHTNGRNSFVQKGGSGSNGEISKDEDVSSDLKNTGSAHSRLDIAGTILNAISEGANGGITVQGFPQQGSNPNHFMRTNPPAFSTLDYWFAGISKERIDLEKNKDVWVQTSFKAWTGTLECFAGILFRTSFLPIREKKKDKPDEDSSSLNKNYGVSGLGLSIARGALNTHNVRIGDGVGIAPANPALFPGFALTNDVSNTLDLNVFKPKTTDSYPSIYNQVGYDFRLPNPLAILWAYDDEKEPVAFRWLAVGSIDNKMLYTESIHYPLVTPFYTTLAAKVWEEKGADGKSVNKIRGWVTSQYNKPYNVDMLTWPSQDSSDNPAGFQPIKWLYVNSSHAQRGKDDFTIVTEKALATEDVHNRAGIVNGAYEIAASTRNIIFRNFAVGTASGEGGEEIVPGLTPGIVQ